MKSNKIWIIILAFVILIALAVIISIIAEARREKRVNHFIFPASMEIINKTNEKRADTIAMIIANKIFLFDTLKIGIVYLPKEYKDGETEFMGFVQKNSFQPHEYFIFVKKGILPISIKKLLSHEMLHVKQYEDGELIPIFQQPLVVYMGDTIDFRQVPYNKRQFEIDAFAKEFTIEKSVNNLLYRK